jgi:uncharacterized protein YecA (UPF0149 family)
MNSHTGEIVTNDFINSLEPKLREVFKPAPFATDEQIKRGKVGRNESCPCGSDKKFKRCCLEL